MNARRDIIGLAIVVTAMIAFAGCIVVEHISSSSVTDASPASDLNHLTESMLVDESAVPPLAGTSWGRIVAAPQGALPPVSPPQCAIFLSQGVALEKGLAMRSSRGSAIGVELAIDDHRVDLATVRDECASFTLDAPGFRSKVRVEPTCLTGLPAGAVSTKLHSETTAAGRSVSWVIAMISGYHRGVLVTAEYTPGPQGGPFDAELASALPALFRAQLARLDAV